MKLQKKSWILSSQRGYKKTKDLGIDLKSPQSAVHYEVAEEITNYIMTGKSSKFLKKQLQNQRIMLKKSKRKVVRKSSNDEKKKLMLVEKQK